MTASMSWELDCEHEEFRASVRPLQPLREQWYSAAQAELLRVARARHDESPDAYWTWVAEQQRWMQPWDTVRTVTYAELAGESV